jgi:hypothetical protein
MFLEEDFLSRPKSDLKKLCTTWHKKVGVELLITDFRVNPIYVSVTSPEHLNKARNLPDLSWVV